MRILLSLICVLLTVPGVAARLELVTSVPLATARQITFDGDLAWVAQNFEGATLLDIADPTAPRVVKRFSPEDMQPLFFRAVPEDDLLICADRFRGLVVNDVSRADAPTTVSVLPLDGMTTHFEVTTTTDGKRLAVLARAGQGVTCVDVSDPADLRVTDEFTSGVEFTRAVAIANGIVYLADGAEGGLKALRLDARGKFTPLYQANLAGPCETLLVHGRRLIAGYNRYGVNMFDLPRDAQAETTPVLTLLSGALRNRSLVRDLATSGNLLIAANHTVGVDLFDISDAKAPVLVDEYLFKDENLLAQGCVVYRGMVYVSAWNGGVVVFRVVEGGE